MANGEKFSSAYHSATPGVVDPSDEAAAAKLWAVYISEAEKYDKALVESWKSDMEGMLIFAGLFSASLTAFLIESYKTLNPDSGNETVIYLAQISQQLAAASSGRQFPLPQLTTFTPPTSSLVCNALWFISLGLSLTCALIATLLEQWARDFLHKADMRSSPVIKARIFSYLYYGLKRFNLHMVVDLVPLLLHASLLFFFSGLVAFLIPVNAVMTVIAATLLGVVAAIYAILTLLPLLYIDCPYRTPLSGTFWRLLQRAKSAWNYHRSISLASASPTSFQDQSMVAAMARNATDFSVQRSVRDYRALVWTVKSLGDDIELEPFVEAISDLLWGYFGPRHTYSGHIRALVNNRDLQLPARIQGLLDSCNTGILSLDASKRRKIICYKAFWAVSSLWRPFETPGETHPPLDFHNFPIYHVWRWADHDVDHYSVSAGALMRWSTFCAVHAHLTEQSKRLLKYRGDFRDHGIPNLEVLSLLQKLDRDYGIHVDTTDHESARSPIPILLKDIEVVRRATPHKILFTYMREAAELDSPPYRWEETQAAISLDPSLQFSTFRGELERTLSIVVHRHLDETKTKPKPTAGPEFHWIDAIISDLCCFWQPDHPIPIPPAIIYYLNHRNSEEVLERVMRESEMMIYLWSCVPITLKVAGVDIGQTTPEDVLTALWRLASLNLSGYTPTSGLDSCLDAVSVAGFPRAHLSLISLIKRKFLDERHWTYFDGNITVKAAIALFNHPIFPAETVVSMPRDLLMHPQNHEISRAERDTFFKCMYARTQEAKIQIISEFIEYCNAQEMPHNAVETLKRIDEIPKSAVHSTHQFQLARSVAAALVGQHCGGLIDAVVNAKFLHIYSQGPGVQGAHDSRIPWLNDPTSRQKLKQAFGDYERKLLSSEEPNSTGSVTRVQAILRGLDAWHADPECL
ncbi:hypothetical protein B0H11DRAFT_1821906 [Mycena galericulata]|nr:hypothetical protein B0H11DRAFT_1821906 [Mycena galericulata]